MIEMICHCIWDGMKVVGERLMGVEMGGLWGKRGEMTEIIDGIRREKTNGVVKKGRRTGTKGDGGGWGDL